LSSYTFRNNSGSLAIFTAIRRAYAIPNFFDTCEARRIAANAKLLELVRQTRA
jgi:hypothetical protein